MKGNTHAGHKPARTWLVLLVAVSSLFVLVSGCDGVSKEKPAETPLKIGLLLNFTGSPEASENRKRAFDLAIKHVNEGGGVLGNPVESVVADATRDPAAAEEAARRLVEVDGIHALVGPNASSAAIADFTESFRAAWDSHDQPVGHFSATQRRRGRWILLPDGAFRRRPRSCPGAGNPRPRLRQRWPDLPGRCLGQGAGRRFRRVLGWGAAGHLRRYVPDELPRGVDTERGLRGAGIGRHRIRGPGPDHRARGYRRRRLQPVRVWRRGQESEPRQGDRR